MLLILALASPGVKLVKFFLARVFYEGTPKDWASDDSMRCPFFFDDRVHDFKHEGGGMDIRKKRKLHAMEEPAPATEKGVMLALRELEIE